ncbi:GNAT family N-acetyltransferase [Streptomyces sp. NPDC021093]|uniref:GNAT family N-acetyltransferase n=1 Tax=Streptomyces sp. NPDC021093 TaxID=3365112 RepID=UPI0037A81A40
MEFTTGGQLEVRLTPDDVGKRVSVRRLTGDSAPGARFADAVGVLTSWDDGVLSITRRSGETVRVDASSLVAAKVVPAAPARRRGPAANFPELARVMARAWEPVESESMGGWTLRAAVQEVPREARPGGAVVGRRVGFTRRANSVLPLGDPGLPLDEALSYVRKWYEDRGLPPYVQVSTGAEGTQEVLGAELAGRGWESEVSAEVRIGALAPVGDLETGGADVRLARSADAAWMSRYQRSEVPGAHVVKVLESGPSVWFATVPGEDGGRPAAIGRCVVDGRWAGFAAVEVDPAHRRRGLATAVMAVLARRALDEGASAAWLQVEDGNTGARGLYDGMGFTVHHRYHHYRSAQTQSA